VAATSRSINLGQQEGELAMKSIGFLCAAILGVASMLAPVPVIAQSSAIGVTGAGEGIFPSSAQLYGVSLSGLELGQGVFIDSDGTTTGQFYAVLLGTSPLGLPQDIAIGGEVSSGAIGPNGSATFSGTATVDLGNGSQPLLGVRFTATATPESLLLILGTSTLPPATLVAGSITIE
jgi:hypothetical protein